MSLPLRALIVDDSEDDVLLVARCLRRGGYELTFERVDTAQTTKDALSKQPWDVIIADFAMPHFTGLDALRLCQETGLDLPFILVSGTIGEETAVAAMKAGAHDYVMKDNLARLAPAVERELREAEVRRQRREAELEIRRRNRELTLLNRVIAASAASLEPESILETVCQELAQAFDLPRAVAAMLDEQQTKVVIVAEYPALPDHHSSLPQISVLNYAVPLTDNPACQQVLQEKTPLVVDDAQNDPRLPPFYGLLHQLNLVSLLILPLVTEDETIGCLILGHITPHHFCPDDVDLAQSVANQVAGALARARLTQVHRRLSTAIEQAAESVIITDKNGTILYVNPAFEQTSGYSRSEAIGQTPRLVRSGNQGRAFYQELWQRISRGHVWHGRFVNRRKDGAIYTEDATITPIRDENEHITNYVSVQRDVTRELELEEQYHQAQKMEAVGRLAAGIAHDFNNLLTAINGFAELLQQSLDPDDPFQEISGKILNAGQRAAALVRQLLAFSRKQTVTPKTLNLNNVVNNIDKMLRRIIGEDIALETKLTPNLWPIKVDPSQIEQIILNLAVNARDAMPNGGRLTIETANVVFDEEFASHHLEAQPGEYVLLAITDNGIGMTEEVMSHIFEPFFTTKEAGQGTGLGLATVFGIVKQSGGHIEVGSEPRQGTTFKVYLPRVEEEISYLVDPDQVSDLPRGQETILLVEDELVVRELAARVLRIQGYTVLEAVDGETALRLAEEHQGDIHLLLTDVIMPHMDGKTLADQLSSQLPDIKVLFASGYTNDRIVQHGVLDLNRDLLLQKPFSPTSLAKQVRKVLDSNSYAVAPEGE